MIVMVRVFVVRDPLEDSCIGDQMRAQGMSQVRQDQLIGAGSDDCLLEDTVG